MNFKFYFSHWETNDFILQRLRITCYLFILPVNTKVASLRISVAVEIESIQIWWRGNYLANKSKLIAIEVDNVALPGACTVFTSFSRSFMRFSRSHQLNIQSAQRHNHRVNILYNLQGNSNKFFNSNREYSSLPPWRLPSPKWIFFHTSGAASFVRPTRKSSTSSALRGWTSANQLN